MKRKINLFFYYLGLILFLEISYKLFLYHRFTIGVIFTSFFSLSIAFLLTFITKVFKKRKYQRNITFLFSLFLIVLFSFHFVYYKLLDTPFSISTITMALQAIGDFHSIGLQAILENIGYILFFSLPLLFLFFMNKNMNFRNTKKLYSLFLSFLFTYILTVFCLLPFKESGYKYYFKTDNMLESIENFGLLTAQRLNIQRYVLGFKEQIVLNKKEEVDDEILAYKENVLDFSFSSLMEKTEVQEEKEILKYFDYTSSTIQNEYTGYFKGKNLIFILAEGFNSIAVSKELTPTLYKLTHTGFVFNNYYSPVFLSTTGGEFQATTGLLPTQEILGLWRKNAPSFPFAIGNAFAKEGYTPNAYHNWTYSYYKRNITMLTLGFTNYMGCKNGLEKKMNCNWLPSDIDLINTTLPMYINENKFVTYYISVSGHAPYNFTGGNSIALKNKDQVKNLDYSDPVKAYQASQIEFDRAIETLINRLEDENKLKDTVIVITGDHYPYTLSEEEINEISSYKRDELFEVNHSNLIIWNGNDDVIKTVDKVGSQIDVLPTLLNLFGIPYDSRMMIGRDILSTSEGLAIFSNHSWISDYGRYNSQTKTFESNNQGNITGDYVNNMNIRVENSFIASKMIVETDIYKKVLGDK